MNEAAKETRRAYQRAWHKNNPEKARAIRERYWTKKAAEAAAAKQTEDRAEAAGK